MKRIRRNMKLADVIRIVGEFARNDHETGLVVADMINRGLIKFSSARRHQSRR